MAIHEFINQYTSQEVEKVQRYDVIGKFQSKQTIQKIATTKAVNQRESSPIRSPVRGKSPGKNERNSPAKTNTSEKSSSDFNLRLLQSPIKGNIYNTSKRL